jgi:Zn-dependent protease with chaperone function
MYLLLGISILLAMLLSFNSFATLASSFLWRVIGKRALKWTPTTRARTLFMLRVLPVTASLAVLMFLILPAYITHEPRSTHESVSYKLGLIALVSAGGIALATFRGLASWRATSRLISDWLTHARRISLAEVGIPCYQIQHQFPVVALVGILRPRLFIASQVVEQLRPEELAGAIHHEVGHLIARDNLKRAFMRVCRDVLLIIPCGRMLDRHWSEASEAAADEHAALGGGNVALDLASALVKIARMIPAGSRPAMPAGVFLIGEEPGGIEARVSRLLQRAGNETTARSWEPWIPKGLLWLTACSSVSTLVLATTHTPTLASIHTLIEHTVYLLS